MKAVTLDVRSPAVAMADFSRVWKSGKAQSAGVLSRAEGGGVEFAFDAVKVEFLLQVA